MARTAITSPLTLTLPAGLAVDTDNSRVLVSDLGAILAVNQNNGTRSIILTDTFQPGLFVADFRGIALDRPRSRAVVVDRLRRELFALNLTTGTRSPLSNSQLPNARNMFFDPAGLVLDQDSGIAFVGDAHRVRAVDLITGRARAALKRQLGSEGRRHVSVSAGVDDLTDSMLSRINRGGVPPMWWPADWLPSQRLPWYDIDAAIAGINAGERPLGLYVFTQDQALGEKMLRETISGGACINACAMQGAFPALGFGGVGQSGTGRHHGIDGFREFSNPRGVFVRGEGGALGTFLPPYGEFAKAAVSAVFGSAD